MHHTPTNNNESRDQDVLSDAASLPDDDPRNLTLVSSSSSVSSLDDDDDDHHPDNTQHDSFRDAEDPPPYSAAAGSAAPRDVGHPSSSRLALPQQSTGSQTPRTQHTRPRRPPHHSNPQPTDPNTSRIAHNPPGAPPIDYSAYLPTLPHPARLSEDQRTITTTLPPSYPLEALTALVRTQAELPPRPALRVKGSQGGRNGAKADFDVWIDLTRWFLAGDMERFPGAGLFGDDAGDDGRDDDTSGDASASRSTQGQHPPILHGGLSHLQAQTADFYNNSSPKKQLTLHRAPQNLDQASLTSRIKGLITSLGYAGDVQVEWPVLYERTVFEADTEAEGEGEESFDVRVDWVFADQDGSGDGARGAGDTPPSPSAPANPPETAEEALFRHYKQRIALAVLARRRGGWLGIEEWIDGVVGGTVAGEEEES